MLYLRGSGRNCRDGLSDRHGSRNARAGWRDDD